MDELPELAAEDHHDAVEDASVDFDFEHGADHLQDAGGHIAAGDDIVQLDNGINEANLNERLYNQYVVNKVLTSRRICNRMGDVLDRQVYVEWLHEGDAYSWESIEAIKDQPAFKFKFKRWLKRHVEGATPEKCVERLDQLSGRTPPTWPSSQFSGKKLRVNPDFDYKPGRKRAKRVLRMREAVIGQIGSKNVAAEAADTDVIFEAEVQGPKKNLPAEDDVVLVVPANPQQKKTVVKPSVVPQMAALEEAKADNEAEIEFVHQGVPPPPKDDFFTGWVPPLHMNGNASGKNVTAAEEEKAAADAHDGLAENLAADALVAPIPQDDIQAVDAEADVRVTAAEEEEEEEKAAADAHDGLAENLAADALVAPIPQDDIPAVDADVQVAMPVRPQGRKRDRGMLRKMSGNRRRKEQAKRRQERAMGANGN